MIALALLAGVAALAAPRQLPSRVPSQAESTRRMAERLAGIGAELRARPGQSGWFFANQPWRIPELRAQLETSPDVPGVRFQLARELLWDGRSGEALLEFETLYAPLDAIPDADLNRRGFDLKAQLRMWLIAAQLRLGEQQNCLGDQQTGSCLFPIRGGGIHRRSAGARGALAILDAVLARYPADLTARWLLNLVHMTLGDYPEGVPQPWRVDPEVFASGHDPGVYADLAAATGSAVHGLAGGAVIEDLDSDGWLDIASSSWGPGDPLRLLFSDGAGRFAERDDAAGLTGISGGLNLSHADFDNDGDADLLVLRGGWLGEAGRMPNSLLRNDGRGFFEDVSVAAGLDAEHPGQVAAWADFDGDGWLDLFVGNETRPGEPLHPCQLYRSTRDGRFVDVAEPLGLARLGWVKGAAWGDYDNDGRPDLYVTRLRAPNLLFRNLGPQPEAAAGWRFAELAGAAGVEQPLDGFPTWFFDYDNDGWLDLFAGPWDGVSLEAVMASYLGQPADYERPRLYRNRGDGGFDDVTSAVGLDRIWLAMGANFGDIDEDGWLDLYVGTGAPDLTALVPNLMYRNDAGRRFQDVTTAGGFGHLQKGHGVAFGDLDQDGDQDIYANIGGWFSGDGFRNALFENPGHGARWLTLRLQGRRANRAGLGARVSLRLETPGGAREIHRVVGTGGSFGSSSLQLELGLGDASRIQSLEIAWPGSGTRQRFEAVPLDRIVVAFEDRDQLVPLETRASRLGGR